MISEGSEKGQWYYFLKWIFILSISKDILQVTLKRHYQNLKKKSSTYCTNEGETFKLRQNIDINKG